MQLRFPSPVALIHSRVGCGLYECREIQIHQSWFSQLRVRQRDGSLVVRITYLTIRADWASVYWAHWLMDVGAVTLVHGTWPAPPVESGSAAVAQNVKLQQHHFPGPFY